MFRRIFFVALLAGLAAGLVATAIQMTWTVPLILEAETYEQEKPSATIPRGHEHAAAPVTGAAPADAHAHTHASGHHDDHAGAEDGLARAGLTTLTNILLGVGGGLLISGAFALRRASVDWKTGLGWGAGAYVAFSLSPSIGLPPELPGTLSADLHARQAWWAFTVFATGGGLLLAAYGKRALLRIGGSVLVLLPHVVGAPQPEYHEATAPPELVREFIMASLLSAACFWLALGAAAGGLAARFRLTEAERSSARAQTI